MADENTKTPPKGSVGAFLYLPMFRPFKACEIAKREIMASARPPARAVDVLIEVDQVRHEFSLSDFLARLGIPVRSELTGNGDDDAA